MEEAQKIRRRRERAVELSKLNLAQTPEGTGEEDSFRGCLEGGNLRLKSKESPETDTKKKDRSRCE